MSKHKSFLITGLLFFSVFSVSYAQWQWEWIHPKPSGVVFNWCKIIDANTFYIAGEYGTFMKTMDGGQNWFINNFAGRPGVNPWNPVGHISDAHVFDTMNIITGGNRGAMRTTNGGETFDSIPGTFLSSGDISCIYFLNTSTGYMVGGNSYLKKSTNGGNTWFDPASFNGVFTGIHTLNDTLIIISSNSGNIFRSSNGGINWTQINTGASSIFYSIKFINKDTVIASGSSNAFRVSSDGGLNWFQRDPPYSSNWYDMSIVKNSGNYIVNMAAGNGNYIAKTTNLGITWDTINIKYPGQVFISNLIGISVLGSGDTLLAVGNNLINLKKGNTNSQLMKGIRFGNSGSLYAQNNNGIWSDNTGQKVWAVGQSQIIGTTFDQILYSSNGGETWTYQPSINASTTFYGIQMVDENTGYTVGSGGMVMKTINGGMNWVQSPLPTSSLIKALDFISPNTGWVLGNDSSLFKTTDGGNSWLRQRTTFRLGSPTQIVLQDIDMVNENTGWICFSGDTNINKTTNGGQDWFIQTPGMNGGTGISMLDANTGYIVGGDNRIRKTINGGENWDIIYSPLSSASTLRDVDFFDEFNGVVVTFTSSIVTTNGGIDWIIIVGNDCDNFPRVKMISPVGSAHPLIYLAASSSGVMKIGDRLLGATNPMWNNNVPEDFILKQNYPNPFNPSTTIEFAIPNQGVVSLKVYDITGREIKTLINNLELSAGTIKQAFDGSGFASSGVYFYSLIVDNKLVGTKKMMLLK